MRGRFHINRQSPDDLLRARDLFQRAIDRNDRNAAAYAGLSYANSMLGMTGGAPPNEAFPRAEAAALNALRTDDLLPEAHLALGMVQGLWEWDFERGQMEIQRAIDLDPTHAEAHMMQAFVLNVRGQPEAALAEARRAFDLDPVSAPIGHALGATLAAMGQHEAAERAPQPDTRVLLTALVYAATERSDEARELIAPFEARALKGEPLSGALAALYHAMLQRAVESREPGVVEFNGLGWFNDLHGNPRFDAILAQVGL